MKIELMKHHIPFIIKYWGEDVDQMRLQKWSYDCFYGEGSHEKAHFWINSLKLNDEINVIKDTPTLNNSWMNLDSFCNGVDCIYQEFCKVDVDETIDKMKKRKPLRVPLLELSLFLSSFMNPSEKGIFVGETYSLNQILQAYGKLKK